MRATTEVRRVGTGDPVSSAKVTVQMWPSLGLCTAGSTDLEGLVELLCQGAPGQVRIHSERGSATYETYSKVEYPVGAFDLEDLRVRLRAGVKAGVLPYGESFAATIGAGSLNLGSGALLLDGIIASFPSTTTLNGLGNGDRAAVGVVSGDAVALADIAYSSINVALHCPLWRYTVVSGAVVPGSLVPIAALAGRKRGRPAVMGVVRSSGGATTNATGAASGLETTITLLPGVTYQILAEGSLITRGTDGAVAVEIDGSLGPYTSATGDVSQLIMAGHVASKTGGSCLLRLFVRSDTALTNWALQASYGPVFNGLAMLNPGQVAVAPISGKIYIADTGNSRLVRLNPDGTYDTSLTVTASLKGVCCDATDSVYVFYATGINPTTHVMSTSLSKYTSSLTNLWNNATIANSTAMGHITTNGTHLYVADPGNNAVQKHLCSDGSLVTSWAVIGSPTGICLAGGNVVVTSNDALYQLQVYDSTGNFLAFYTPGLSDPRGIVLTAGGRFAVCDYGTNRVATVSGAGALGATFAVTTPVGIGLASGDVLWVGSSTVQKWDETPFIFNWDSGLLTVIAIPR